MADDIIKNPSRTLPKTQVPYEPEHVRQGINVQAAPKTPQPVVKPLSEDLVSPYLGQMDSYMGLDGDGLDDNGNVIPFDNGHVIDNNDFVNLGYDSTPRRNVDVPPVAAEAPVDNAAAAPQVGDYILMVMGKLVTSGDIEKIQAKVKNIMYGDDPAFSSLEISMDDIVVLKRVNVKVGIFVDG